MPLNVNPRFGHLITAMVTPFDENLELDIPRARQLARRLADQGNDALVICGTTGESPTVFYPQKMELFRAVIDEVGGEIPIIANVGDNCTADTVDFARDVEKLGVDGFLLVVPYYNKPPQEGLYRHYRTIAEAVPNMPCILYNIPGRCVINMLPETTLRLANDVDNIVGIKEASGSLEQAKQIIDNAPAGFDVWSGEDNLTYEMMKLGGAGVISTIGNVAAPRMKEICELTAAGKFDEAEAAHEALLPLMNELFITANPIMVKKSLELVGFPVGGVRLPLIDANEEQTASLKRVMEEVGVL